MNTKNYEYAGLSRRLLALLYDAFLIIALLLLASLPAIALNQGEALNGNVFYQLYLLLIMFFYYSWQWRHGGQTLAMVTWKIKVVSTENTQLTWQQCAIRFSFGFLGLSILTVLFNTNNVALHDKLSKTVCIKS